MPAELDEAERKIRQLEIERQAVKKESDPASKERLSKMEKELEILNKTSSEMKAHWNKEKEVISEIRRLKEEQENIKTEEMKAERSGNLEKVAEIRYGKGPGIQKELEKQNKKLEELQKTTRCSKKRWTKKT